MQPPTPRNSQTTHTLPTAAKPQTSKEVIAANVQLLIEQLEAGHSEALTAYLTAMGRFHNYSFGNILEIARQMPDGDPRCGALCVEPAWTQGDEGPEGYPHPRPDDRHPPQEETPKQQEMPQPLRSPFSLVSAPLTSSISRRPKGQTYRSSLEEPKAK